ncbi:hypothetical protein FQA39_LY03083 [Lamprigera yunnana]|nr:hypothetical protein FQA39_LY03083 [Lamprigera yunnana]
MTKVSPVDDTHLLTVLNVQATERIISVRENGHSDANFILTNLMKKIFTENDRLCLVIMHNTIGHYRNILKRLGQDVVETLQSGSLKVIEPLKTIATDDLGTLLHNKQAFVRDLFLDIRDKMNELLDETHNRVHLMIDDISHLSDLGVDRKYIIAFVNYCVNLSLNPRVVVIINCHVSDTNDEIIWNSLQYASNLCIDVSDLKTGFSSDVTGVITIKRCDRNELSAKSNTFHYKALDRVIKVFAPGESIYHLYNFDTMIIMLVRIVDYDNLVFVD